MDFSDLDPTSPDFAANIVHLLSQGHLGNICWADTRFCGEGQYRLRGYLDDSLLSASNFAHLEGKLAGKAGWDAEEGTLTPFRDDGSATDALLALGAVFVDYAEYPVLDECDYSTRQCDAADEFGLQFYGDDMYEAWRAGELTELVGWCGDPDTVPAPDVQPDATCWQELTGDARAFIQGHAQSQFLESDSAF